MANRTVYLPADEDAMAEQMRKDDLRSLSNLVAFLIRQEWLRRQEPLGETTKVVRPRGEPLTAKASPGVGPGTQSPQSFPVMERR